MLIRLVPIFPFWFVNIAPSIFGMKFRNFALGTFLGILPGSFVYTQAGNGLSTALESDLQNETSSSFLMKSMMNADMIFALTLLGGWFILLLVLKQVLKKKKLASDETNDGKTS